MFIHAISNHLLIHKPILLLMLVPTMKVIWYSYLRNNIVDIQNDCNAPQDDTRYNLDYRFENSMHAYFYKHQQPCNPFEVVDMLVGTDHDDPEFPKSRNPRVKYFSIEIEDYQKN